MANNNMWEPCRIDEFPLWELNHSPDKLYKEQKLNYSAYKLGYEMKEEVDDPTNKAYKFFSEEQYPEGNVVTSGMYDYDPNLPVALTFDFNRRPQTGALCQKQGDKYLVFEQLWIDEAIPQEKGEHAVSVLSDWNIEKVTLYGDATANQRAGKYGRTNTNQFQVIKRKLEEGGIRYDSSKLRQQNPKIITRVNTVNDIIYAGTDSEDMPIRRLLVHERCDKVIDDYRYSIIADSGAKEGQKIDNGERGHISDAVDYWVFEHERKGNSYTYIT